MPQLHSNSNESNPRNKIIDIYLKTIRDSLKTNSPALKLVNFGTGSGKTFQFFNAIYQIIEENPESQIVGLYVAPLREHLSVPAALVQAHPNVPTYILYSREWETERFLLEKYSVWLPAIRRDQKLWASLYKVIGQDESQKANTLISKALGAISEYQGLERYKVGGSDLLKSKLQLAQYTITGSIESFLDILIRAIPDETTWSDECQDLVKIFYPLFLLREQSGILLMTYSKFETRIPYFVSTKKRWIKRSVLFDQYVRERSETCRFLFAFDEQEDGYQSMLEEQIDIISPHDLAINNALSSIYREFALLLAPENKGNRDFLRFIKNNPGALREWGEHFDKQKPIDGKLLALSKIYQELTEFEGNSAPFLNQIAQIDAGIQASFKNIENAFASFGQAPIPLDFDRFSQVLSTFGNNRTLMIPHDLYARYAADLATIFSYNNLYIYNIAALKNLSIHRKNSGHVLINEQTEENQDNLSVAELIYTILAIRFQIDAIRKLLGFALEAEDSQSRSIDIWHKQIIKLQDAGEGERVDGNPSPYLNRRYVYKSAKSIINIKEISRYKNQEINLIHSPLREISIGSTAIITSPEHRILSLLHGTGNVIFLISATGGVHGDLATSFDLRYLEDELRDENTGRSSFAPMRTGELELSEIIRNYRLLYRTITVRFFGNVPESFPNTKTIPVIERFDQHILKKYIDGIKTDFRWFSIHKVHELEHFTRFLFYLFEDDSIKSLIAFTQTLTHIRRLIQYAAKLEHGQFIFQETETHPGIYTVEIQHETYQSPVRIKLILYESKFNSLYRGTVDRTYLDELVEQDGEKIFFISAYQSASKGLNPTIKRWDGDQDGKDFDAIVLLMDQYYSIMGQSSTDDRKAEKTTAQVHFTLMKNLVSHSDSTIEIKDFNAYLSDPEAEKFKDLQHRIQLGKGILQAIGRTERRDFDRQVIKIFLNEESRRNLVNYYAYLEHQEPNELLKLSVNNHAVYRAVLADEATRTIRDYDDHVYDEVKATNAFQEYRKTMLSDIDHFHAGSAANGIVERWELLRNPLAFRDPAKYLELLPRNGFPEDFIESLFYRRKTDQPEFEPYLANEPDDVGRKVMIISDSVHGDSLYRYLPRLYPDFLRMGARATDVENDDIPLSDDPSTDNIRKMYRKILPNPWIFEDFIPRPRFFYDVFFPALAENMVTAWIQEVIYGGKKWPDIKAMFGITSLTNFRKYNQLFERFDLYYIRGTTLYCIDVKAWSEPSGYRLSAKTVDKTLRKLEEIQSAYPEFTSVKGLLLNLHAPSDKTEQLSSSLSTGTLFYPDQYNNPIESVTLRYFLIGKR